MTLTLMPDITRQVTLSDITWTTYQAMLHDLGDNRNTRLAYHQGVLEITMPSHEHERLKHLLERIIISLTLELDMPVSGYASVTLSREDLKQSIEPDACYYFKNAARVRGERLDLSQDPPPDLALEVDITHPSDRKQNIYAALGVPELWIAAQQQVRMYGLTEGTYQPLEESGVLAGVTPGLVGEWLELGAAGDDNAVSRAVRTWVRSRSI